MDFDAFYKALQEENVCKRDLLMLHFRISTHGFKTAEHTHPFPISTEKTDLELLAYESNMVCAHNGIFHLQGQPNDISDTMYYIQGWLSNWDLARLNSAKTDLKDVIDADVSFSKIALIINGSVHMFGNWIKHQGCYYSNTGPISVAYYSSITNVPTSKWAYSSADRYSRQSYGSHKTYADSEAELYYGGGFDIKY
jgi:predicted glutamine amidotransferase